MQRINFILRFLRYYFKAQTKYHIHSPFVYEFCEKILEDDRMFYAFERIENFRSLLKSDETSIKITDHGAGSQISKANKRSVASLTKHSASHPIFCRILFRLIQQYQLKSLIELGTSMGISSLYQAAAAIDGQLTTLEGCPNIAKQSRKHFTRMAANNIELVEGVFENTLPQVLSKTEEIDYVFFDGNHRKKPTLDYFYQCLQKAHTRTIFVIDDNHWSEEMEEAWEAIKAHSEVTMTIDLFFCGLVFFRKDNKQKEHFTLINSLWKPWSIGIRDLLFPNP